MASTCGTTARACPLLCADPQRQGCRPRRPDPVDLAHFGDRPRHQGRELNPDGRVARPFRARAPVRPDQPGERAYNPLLEVRRGEWEVRDVQNIADVLVDPEGALEAALARRLDHMPRQIERLERHVTVSNRAIALFVRFWLTSTPPLPDSAQTYEPSQGPRTVRRVRRSARKADCARAVAGRRNHRGDERERYRPLASFACPNA